MSELWVGTSGYVYTHWRHGVFYPQGLRQREELTYYARRFRTGVIVFLIRLGA